MVVKVPTVNVPVLVVESVALGKMVWLPEPAFTALKMGVSEPGAGPGAGRNRGAPGQAPPAGAGTPPAAPPQ